MHEYYDAIRGVLLSGQRDVGIWNSDGSASQFRVREGKQTCENPPREVVLGGADVSLGVVVSSLGRSHRFGDVF